MFKKFLVVSLVACMSLFAGNAFAQGDCEGPNCEPTVNADIEPAVDIHGSITIVPGGNDLVIGFPESAIQHTNSGPVGGNFGTADVVLNADAAATGQDTEKFVGYEYTGDGEKGDPGWYRHKWSWVGDALKPGGTNGKSWTFLGTDRTALYELIPGVSESFGRNELTLTSDVNILSNSPQSSGLAYTIVDATTRLDIEGVAWAKGTDGCPQTASIDVDGSLTAYAYGGSFSEGLTEAYAGAYGSGLTTVSFTGHEQDASNYGGWFSPNKASVDFDSTITVSQKGFFASYTSPDGATAANLAFVGGGNAQSTLGSDATLFNWFAKDNIQLTGIEAAGKVGQEGRAIQGGAIAYGNSQASFSGANGSVETIPGGCFSGSPGQTANVGGYAVVAGYNNVNVQNNMIKVTSVQYSKATTGNSGPAIQIQTQTQN